MAHQCDIESNYAASFVLRNVRRVAIDHCKQFDHYTYSNDDKQHDVQPVSADPFKQLDYHAKTDNDKLVIASLCSG